MGRWGHQQKLFSRQRGLASVFWRLFRIFTLDSPNLHQRPTVPTDGQLRQLTVKRPSDSERTATTWSPPLLRVLNPLLALVCPSPLGLGPGSGGNLEDLNPTKSGVREAHQGQNTNPISIHRQELLHPWTFGRQTFAISTALFSRAFRICTTDPLPSYLSYPKDSTKIENPISCNFLAP